MNISLLINNFSKNNIVNQKVLKNLFVTHADSDYIAFRTIYNHGVYCSPFTYAHIGCECIEKILKSYILLKKPNVNIKFLKKYNHNLEKIRINCAIYDSFFIDEELKIFCQNYSYDKKGNEVLRYGLADSTHSYIVITEPFTHLVDKIFIETLIRLDSEMIQFSQSALIYSNYKSKQFIPVKAIENIKSIIEFNNHDIIKLKNYFCK
jgi:hypothetical protein